MQKFYTKIDKFKYTLYSIYNKNFLFIVLIKKECYYYYTEKILPKKFFTENNIDLEEVPKKLKILQKLRKC